MKLLRIDEVATMLDVTVPRAYEMARSGLLPVVRLGRQLRINPDDLRHWIESGGKPLKHGWRREKPIEQ